MLGEGNIIFLLLITKRNMANLWYALPQLGHRLTTNAKNTNAHAIYSENWISCILRVSRSQDRASSAALSKNALSLHSPETCTFF